MRFPGKIRLSGILKDYKFFCFNGNVRCFKIDFGRFVNHRANYYDRNCKLLPFGEDECPPDESVCLDLAKNLKKPLLAIEVVETNLELLKIYYPGLDRTILFENKEDIFESLEEKFKRRILRKNKNGLQHNFLMGLHGSSSWRSAMHSPLPAATETAEGYAAGIHNFYLLRNPDVP